jgi:DNA-binding beta-propeller fold protein YncE
MYFAAGQPKAAGTVDGYGISTKFDAPAAIAVDGKGTFYITDSRSNLVRRMQYDSTKFDFKVTTFAGAAGTARFNEPTGLTVDPSGNVLVCDTGNHVIRRITPGGDVSTLAGTLGTAGHQDGSAANALFNRPLGIAIDPFGNLYVAEEGNHDIRKIAPNGHVTTVASGFDKPGLLTIAPDGSIWIPDAGNGRLLRAAPTTGQRRRAVRR